MDATVAGLCSLFARRGVRLRGRTVLLDSDLAAFYQVHPTAVRRAVRRNRPRFPEEYAWELTAEERRAVFGAGRETNRRAGRRPLAWAFPLPGGALLASVLHSSRAITLHIDLIRSLAGPPALGAAQTSPSVQAVFEILRQLLDRARGVEPKPGRHSSSPLVH